MSVNVFGHSLGKTEGKRGPPGIGYRLTIEGHYDIDNKRLCNVASPNQPTDAVNADTVKHMISSEIKSLYEVTARLRSEIDDLNILLKVLKSEINEEVEKKVIDLKDLVEVNREEIDNQNLKLTFSVKEIQKFLNFIQVSDNATTGGGDS